MNPLLTNILAVLRQHKGRDAAISAPDIARRIGLTGKDAGRLVRYLLSEAETDGTLEELEMPVIGIGGLGYYLADDVDDFVYRDALLSVLARRARLKQLAWRRLAKSFGITITKLIIK